MTTVFRHGVFVSFIHKINAPKNHIGFCAYMIRIVAIYEWRKLRNLLILTSLIAFLWGLSQGLGYRKSGLELFSHILFSVVVSGVGIFFLYIAWLSIHYWGLWKSETRIEGNSLCYGKDKKIERYDIKEFIFLNDRVLKINSGNGGPSGGTILVYLENESDISILKAWFEKQ